MLLLLFVVSLIQFFTYWVFKPLELIAEYVLEIRFFPVIALVVFILLFSTKKIEKN
tara:strand:+ start:199 stop:366 length:168 start_codon:yes stop_codon:yes gene_type:complete